MRNPSKGIFATWAPKYRELGYWPRPVYPGTKACKIKRWQRPDHLISQDERDSWVRSFRDYGIGLLLGSPFPDGTFLGTLDVDRDDMVRVTTTLLGTPACGRIGARGILFPVRIKGSVGYRKLQIKTVKGEPTLTAGELLGVDRFAVLPPTVHPVTRSPYQWVGKPLYEIPYTDLPILEV